MKNIVDDDQLVDPICSVLVHQISLHNKGIYPFLPGMILLKEYLTLDIHSWLINCFKKFLLMSQNNTALML